MTGTADDPILRYHDGTKHHFHRFAASLGYLDWASQPAPFRSFAGAPEIPLPRRPTLTHVSYERLFHAAAPLPVSIDTIGDLLRYALGLSAWKQLREPRLSTGPAHGAVQPRWSLRVNPSSGNLHPTEAYVVVGPVRGLPADAGVYHYAPDRHALEQRCAFSNDAWRSVRGDPSQRIMVALTSIHWREAWKYGERAFRYCQHDLGHAIAALRLSASLAGWRLAIAPSWPHRDLAALTGIERDDDYRDAEREEPACLLTVDGQPSSPDDRHALVAAVRAGEWSGRASQLSHDHVDWSFIDEIAHATEDRGRVTSSPPDRSADVRVEDASAVPADNPDRPGDAQAILLQRRSALAFDGRSPIGVADFTRMLQRAMPAGSTPWDAVWWTPRVHLVLFVHRVERLDPGLYLLARDRAVVDRLRAAFGRDLLWEQMSGSLPLYCLARGECRRLAARVSCDQDIAADGFFSLAMLADFERSLDEFGPAFYRHLFWETGVVGQVLYLEAEAAGARATGIGCFYDDPVHDVLGLRGHAFQSLYHFAVGMPVEDPRLTSAPGYEWETRQDGAGSKTSKIT